MGACIAASGQGVRHRSGDRLEGIGFAWGHPQVVRDSRPAESNCSTGFQKVSGKAGAGVGRGATWIALLDHPGNEAFGQPGLSRIAARRDESARPDPLAPLHRAGQCVDGEPSEGGSDATVTLVSGENVSADDRATGIVAEGERHLKAVWQSKLECRWAEVGYPMLADPQALIRIPISAARWP